MRANNNGASNGAANYSKVPGAGGTGRAGKDIVGGSGSSSTNNKPGARPPAVGARAGPNVRARAAGGVSGARGSSRGGGEDADQIMSYESMKGGAAQRSGSASRRAGASAAAYQA